MNEATLYRELFETATAFCDLRLWETYANAHCFAVKVEEEEHPLFASILGNGGEEFGLSLMRGEAGYDRLLTMFSADFDDDAGEQMNILGFTMTPMALIPPDFRRPFQLAGPRWTARGAVVPFFLIKELGKRPRGLCVEDARLVLHVLKGVLKAHHGGLLTPKLLMPGGEMLTLTLSGDVADPDVGTAWIKYEEGSAPTTGEAAPLVGGIESLPILPHRWFVGFPVLPIRIDNDDRTVRAVLVVDAASELILGTEVVAANDMREASNCLLHTLEQARGLPREMVFSSRQLFDAVAPGLESLGVTCTLQTELPVLNRVVAELVAHFGANEGGSRRRRRTRRRR